MYDFEPGDDVQALLGSRLPTGTVEKVESEATILGHEYRVHVDINGSTIITPPDSLRSA